MHDVLSKHGSVDVGVFVKAYFRSACSGVILKKAFVLVYFGRTCIKDFLFKGEIMDVLRYGICQVLTKYSNLYD